MQTERALLKGILKRIVSLGLPLHYIMHVVDAAMVGQLGTDLLAGILAWASGELPWAQFWLNSWGSCSSFFLS